MIEKLQDGEFRESVISAKLNELIDAYNELQEKYDMHYHVTEDGVGPTTGPNIK